MDNQDPTNGGEEGSSRKRKATKEEDVVVEAPKAVIRNVNVTGTIEFGLTGLGERVTSEDDVFEIKYPVLLFPFYQASISMVACGAMHTAAVVAGALRDEVFTWGVNDDGVLGRETSEIFGRSSEPVDLSITPGRVEIGGPHFRVAQIACGDHHMSALSKEGNLYVWGKYKDPEGLSFLRGPIKEPFHYPFLAGAKVTMIASAGSATLFIVDNNLNFVGIAPWEKGSFGGTEDLDTTTLSEEDFGAFEVAQDVARVWASNLTWIFERMVNGVSQRFSLGGNHRGQLGFQSPVNPDPMVFPFQTTPRQIVLPGRVLDIKPASDHTMALCDVSNPDEEPRIRVFMCGGNDNGQTGMEADASNGFVSSVFFESLATESKETPVSIGVGDKTSFVLTKSGFVYGFGYNGTYNLGIGTDSDVRVPVRLNDGGLCDQRVNLATGGSQFSIFVLGTESVSRKSKTIDEKARRAAALGRLEGPKAKVNRSLRSTTADMNQFLGKNVPKTRYRPSTVDPKRNKP